MSAGATIAAHGGMLFARRLARSLGWFSVALGLAELVGARRIARTLGMRRAGVLRAFGAREVAAGIGLLSPVRKGPWMWARVAGDVLDVGTLASAAGRNRRGARSNATLALTAVAPIVLLDLYCASRLGRWG